MIPSSAVLADDWINVFLVLSHRFYEEERCGEMAAWEYVRIAIRLIFSTVCENVYTARGCS